MKDFLAVLLVAACCIAIDLPSLARSRRFGQLAVFILLWIAGISATLCTVFKVQVPSPLYLIIWLYTPVNDLFQRMLG